MNLLRFISEHGKRKYMKIICRCQILVEMTEWLVEKGVVKPTFLHFKTYLGLTLA